MASCSLAGASNLKLFNNHSEFEKTRCAGLIRWYKTKCAKPEAFHGLRGIEMRNIEPACAAGFNRKRSRFTNPLLVSCTSSGNENDPEDVKLEENNNIKDDILPSSIEVQSLLTTICDTTSIAELELKLAGFRVYVKRDLVEKSISPPAPSIPLTQANISSQTPELNGSAAATSLAIANPKPPSEGVQSILNTATDEGLVILQSPKVGFFRKSRTIKGKRTPPSCKEKQVVKEGQVLCYIEQLGGEIPIESDVSGEIIKILRADGEPVGYGDALIAILPSFPGIKKLQ